MEALEPRVLLDGVPTLEAGELLEASGAPVSVAIMSAASVADWNADGKKDLLVGQFTDGKISVFLNQGTDADPVLGSGRFVQSGGSDITTTYG